MDRDCSVGKSALCANIGRVQPETLQAVFEFLAVSTFNKNQMRPELMRLDSTVVKSHIVPPSDSRLLDDGIRVLSRLYAQSRDRTDVKLRLVDYRKRSRKLAGAIFYGKKAEKDQLYKELIPLAKRVVEQSHRAIEQVKRKSLAIDWQFWVDDVLHYRDLLARGKRSNHDVLSMRINRLLNGVFLPRGTHSEPNIES